MAYTERYVTQGAGGSGDGSSGDPWTLAEGFLNAVAGDRVNIQSDAGYSVGASEVTNSGTLTQSIAFRGYNSSIGDLDGQGRNADTSLNITNFPVITLTGRMSPTAHNLFQNIKFTGGFAGEIFGGFGDNNVLINCNILQTSTGSAVLGDDFCTFIECDIECSNTTHGDIITSDIMLSLIGCRILGSATSGSSQMVSYQTGVIIGNAFLGTTSLIGLNFESLEGISIAYNTFYNLATAIQTPNAAGTSLILVNNHVTDCTKYLDNLYSGTANIKAFEAFNRTRDNTTPRTGISDEALLLGEVTTDTGGAETDYVDAGNGDITLISGAPGVDAGLGV